MRGRCFDCGRDRELTARTPRAKRPNLCASCWRKRRAGSDPLYRLRRSLATHNCRSSTGRVELTDVLGQLCKQGFKCMYCRTPLPQNKVGVDHIVPVIAGGPHRPENIACACHECNSSKQHFEVRAWMASKGYEVRPLLEEKIRWLTSR